MNYGKSLCILCRQPLSSGLAGSMIAHPEDCPTHHFHCDCLVAHSKKDLRCPIDQIPFEAIILDNDVPLVMPPAKKERRSDKQKAEEDKVKEKGPARPTATVAEGVNTNNPTIPKKKPDSDSITPESALCALCGEDRAGTRASPNCCNHQFHNDCLKDYLRTHSVCPIEGCHREVASYTNDFGLTTQLEMTVECEFRNMASAPDNFHCPVCGKADIGRHRGRAKPCGHLCHRQCLTDHVRDHKTCPICKRPTKIIECDTSGRLWFP